MEEQNQSAGAGLKPAPTGQCHGLPEIVLRNTPGTPVRQRNYYEHVIRNEESLNDIRQYIINNPQRWGDDEENPLNQRKKHANRTSLSRMG